MEELYQQNTVFNEHGRAQYTQLDEMQATLHVLQQQVATLLRGVPTSIQPQPQSV